MSHLGISVELHSQAQICCQNLCWMTSNISKIFPAITELISTIPDHLNPVHSWQSPLLSFILISSSTLILCLWSGLFTWKFPTKTLYLFHVSLHVNCLGHLILLHFLSKHQQLMSTNCEVPYHAIFPFFLLFSLYLTLSIISIL
jgi:hypothetical protein